MHAYDAMHDREVTILWLRAFAEGHDDGNLAFHRLPGHELDLTTHSTLFSGEQSNSSLMFGEDSLMKVFRKVTFGHNPDIEIHARLTEAGSDHVAELYGWVEAPGHASTAGEPLHLAMLQQFLRTASDGWDLALASVRDLFAEADLHADEVGGDFAGESHRLGVATGEVHRTLGEVFPTETWQADQQKSLASAMRERLDAAVLVVPALADHADRLRAAYDAVEALGTPLTVQRVHGDLHLGQTLRTVRGWKIVDFEGEPAKAAGRASAARQPVARRGRDDAVLRLRRPRGGGRRRGRQRRAQPDRLPRLRMGTAQPGSIPRRLPGGDEAVDRRRRRRYRPGRRGQDPVRPPTRPTRPSTRRSTKPATDRPGSASRSAPSRD